MVRRSISFEDDLIKFLDDFTSENDFKNLNETVNLILKNFMETKKAEDLNKYILNGVSQIFESQLDLFEQNISQRILKLVSNLAIEQGVLNLLLSNSLELSDEDRKEARKIVIENIKENNNLFRYAKR